MGIINQNIINRICLIIKKTGKLLLKEFYKKQTIHYKNPREIVTRADFLSEKIILSALKKVTPDWQIISEEKGDNHKKSDYAWIVDPLDGTTNFYMGNPLFAIQIALVYKNTPVLSIIYVPFLDELYVAQKNQGAYLNNKKIHVSDKKMDRSILTYCHGSSKAGLKKGLRVYNYFKTKDYTIRQLGSSAVEFALVAKGKTECYITPATKIWDMAPGALLVQEAGGKVYNFKGQLWQLPDTDVFASNGVIDQAVIKFLKTIKS